ncbi:MAG: dihydropteroate synthase [Pseudomonadota bacterium]
MSFPEPRRRPQIMGVVNVTPDSFSDGGRYLSPAAALDHARALIDAGADILDIGGESTRPGADVVPVEEEMDRVVPVIEALASRVETPLSVDTRNPATARAAVGAGAAIWNDVSALTHAPDGLATAATLDCQLVLMHARGDPKTMQAAPHYDDVVAEVAAFLRDRVAACEEAGISRRRIFVDPGIGFGKTLAHNLALLGNLEAISPIAPVLLGASRKRFIAAIDRDGPAETRLGGSIAAALAGAAQGVAIVRVHDVAETRQALAVFEAINRASH